MTNGEVEMRSCTKATQFSSFIYFLSAARYKYFFLSCCDEGFCLCSEPDLGSDLDEIRFFFLIFGKWCVISVV